MNVLGLRGRVSLRSPLCSSLEPSRKQIDGGELKMLSNFDIEDMLKSVDTFAGVFSRDKMPTVSNNRRSGLSRSEAAKRAKRSRGTDRDESGVVNLDDDSGPGTHWVAYIVDKNLPIAFYFDSFGMPPPKEIVRYLHKLSPKPLAYNSSQIQNISSILCGYYCVYVLKKFYRSERDINALYDILYSFDQEPVMDNEKKMLKIFTKPKV